MTSRSHFHDDSEDSFADDGSEGGDLSPSDGYFNDRAHPRDVYVDEPTTTLHRKELEATQESRSWQTPGSSSRADDAGSGGYTPSSPSRYTPPSRTASTPDENIPLLGSQSLYDTPPPAYTADRLSYDAVERPRQSRLNPLASRWVQELRALPFSAGAALQSMGNPSIGFDLERNLYGKRARGTILRFCGRMCTILFWAFAAILVAVTVWLAMAPKSSSKHNHEPEYSSPSKPHWPLQCADGSNSESTFDFDSLSSFSLEELVEVREFYGGIHGRIGLVAGPQNQASPVHVKVSMTASEPYSIKSLRIGKSRNGMTIMPPELARSAAGHFNILDQACLLVVADIFVKPGTALETLDISSTNLEIVLAEGFEAKVDKMSLKTVFTRILSQSSTYSRETRLRTGSGTISGSYSLYDLLEVSTQSGSINIDVNPKKAGKEEKPAKLQCTSRSGSVSVNMPGTDSLSSGLPKRDYQTFIKADVGSISGTYIHGTRTDLESRTGSMRVELLPFSADAYESRLTTTVTTGMTYVDLKSPYNGTTIKRMTSSHTTQAGSLHLRYPQEWEGDIHGSSTTGSLTLKGKDVIVDELDDGWVGKSVKAHKGKGDLKGSLTFKALTGSADITVGDT